MIMAVNALHQQSFGFLQRIALVFQLFMTQSAFGLSNCNNFFFS